MIRPGRIALGMLGVVLMTSACQLHVIHPLAKLDPSPRLPQTEGTYLNMGRSLLASNQPTLAHDAVIRSIQAEGVSAAALTGAGLSAEKLGLLHEAKRYFIRAKSMEPASVVAHNNLGVIHYRLKDYHAAKQAFQAAFALSSGTNQVAEHNLGLSDFAIRRAESRELELAANPAPVQRMGSGVYTLPDPKKKEKEG